MTYNEQEITWEAILTLRRQWAELLMRPETTKAVGIMGIDVVGDVRSDLNPKCCLGHAAHHLSKHVPFAVRHSTATDDVHEWDGPTIVYDNSNTVMSALSKFMYGLQSASGLLVNVFSGVRYDSETDSVVAGDDINAAASLAILNDRTEATPQAIGRYLLSVIDGGNGTPFLSFEQMKLGHCFDEKRQLFKEHFLVNLSEIEND